MVLWMFLWPENAVRIRECEKREGKKVAISQVMVADHAISIRTQPLTLRSASIEVLFMGMG